MGQLILNQPSYCRSTSQAPEVLVLIITDMLEDNRAAIRCKVRATRVGRNEMQPYDMEVPVSIGGVFEIFIPSPRVEDDDPAADSVSSTDFIDHCQSLLRAPAMNPES